MRLLADMSRRPAVHAGGYLTLALLLIAAPLQLNDYRVSQLNAVLVFTIVLVGLNLVMGFGGMISLGHGALFAMGAYTTAVLVHRYGWPHLATLPVSVATTSVLGALIGIPALRLRGLYLALVTVGVAICAVPFFKRFDWLGGAQGISLSMPWTPGGLSHDQWAYYVSLVIAIAGFVAARNIIRSGVGRALRAASANELAASTYGVNIAWYRLSIYVLSAGYAGIAGGLHTMSVGFASPDSFPLTLSITLFIGAIVGGLGSVSGPVLGALFVQYVPVWAADIERSLADAIYGIILIVVLLIAPQGVAGIGRSILRWLDGLARPRHPGGKSAVEPSTPNGRR